jgi:hypothetical protein
MSKIAEIDLYSQRAQVRKRVSELTLSYIGFDAEAKRLQKERWTLQAGKPLDVPDSAALEAVERAADELLADPQADPEAALGLNARSLDIRIRAAEKRRDITASARANAARLLNEIDAKITAAEVPAKLARVEPLRVKVRTAFDALIEALAEYLEACATERISADVFPEFPIDIRSNGSAALNQISHFTRLLVGYGLRKMRKAA